MARPTNTTPRGFDEPWAYVRPHVQDSKGGRVYADDRKKEHLTQAVNAVAGKDMTALKGLISAAKEAISLPSVRTSARLKKELDAFCQCDTVPVGTVNEDADVRGMLKVINQLTGSLVETTAIIRRVYTEGTPDELSNAVRLKPRTLNGWRLRTEAAIKSASYYVAIPEEPKPMDIGFPEQPEVYYDNRG